MRALTSNEVLLLDRYISADMPIVTITGFSPTFQNITMLIGLQSTRPPQPIGLPKSQLRYKQVCNPQRQVVMSDIWMHESVLDSNGNPKLYTTGYIPSSTSGVTVGYGIDVGALATTPAAVYTQLQTWGLSQEGLKTLTPYMGLRGTDAQFALLNFGAPTISTADAQTISKNAMQAYSDHAASQFNSLNPNITFNQLPGNAQTALTDIAFWRWSFSAPGIPAGFTAAL